MNIKNSIAKWVLGGYSYIGNPNGKSYLRDFAEVRQEFAQVIFMNIVELLTDITNDVTLVLKKGNSMLFAEFNVFFSDYGQMVLNKLFNKGYAVIAYNSTGFILLEDDEYSADSKNKVQVNNSRYSEYEIYVMKSDSFMMNGVSDRAFLSGFLKYLDNVLNASNTTTARLGTIIMASPQNVAGSPVMQTITDAEKKQAEEDISRDYGGLKNQRQIQIWRQAMNFTTISLSGLDGKTIEKSKFAIEAICDRLKVPANQVSIIEASSNSNSLSAGGQVREGDLLKYKSFERLLNKTFIKMARDLDLQVDYTIYNKPITPTTTI